MQRLLQQAYSLPIIGDFLYYAIFVVQLVIIPVVATFGGCQRLKFGSSVIWIPKQKAQIVRDGVELLRSRAPEMYSRLTSKERLIILYIPRQGNLDKKAKKRVFLIHDKFVQLGAEGIACFIVQSLMIASALHHFNTAKLDEQERAALKSVSRNMVEWLSEHSFPDHCISPYRKVVEGQEQRASTVQGSTIRNSSNQEKGAGPNETK